MRRTHLVPLVLALVAAPASVARAHFHLDSPADRAVQDPYGSPQKSAPCGMSDTAGIADESTPTGAITTVRTGSMLTITIHETIFHPGHYRVALAQDMAGLPADPAVTPGGTACGSTTIAANPTLPVLADGLLVHTSTFGSAAKTMQVQLPPGMTCTNCVLQVTQFMSNHPLNNPGGCFYHHCAMLTIANDGPVDPGPDAGVDGGGGGDEGGCCSTGGDARGSLALAAAVAAVLIGRRRRSN